MCNIIGKMTKLHCVWLFIDTCYSKLHDVIVLIGSAMWDETEG